MKADMNFGLDSYKLLLADAMQVRVCKIQRKIHF